MVLKEKVSGVYWGCNIEGKTVHNSLPFEDEGSSGQFGVSSTKGSLLSHSSWWAIENMAQWHQKGHGLINIIEPL